MDDWNGIEEFVAVATAGSFVGGARALGASTSHMSRAIAQLEARLQTPLLIRTTRKVALTDTGRSLLDPFRRLVQSRQEAFAMAGGGAMPRGELRLTCSVGLGERFIAPVLRRYAMDYPALVITFDLTNRLVDLVGEGYDLAIRTGQLSDSSLVGTRIAMRRQVVCAAPAYLDRRGRPETLEALAGHDCLVGMASTWQFRVDGKDRNVQPRARLRCNSGPAVADAAIAGLGICQLPAFYVADAIARGELEEILPALRRADEPVWAVYPQQRHVPPKVRLLVDRLKQEWPVGTFT